MDRKKCFWFGTEEYADWFPTPNQGADSSPSGWGTEATLLNGGAFVSNSWATHKKYTYEWPSSSSPEVAQKMKSYRDGTYGRGLLYFLDPMIYRTNVLPAHWADPSMTLDNEAPSLVYGVEPTPVATSGWQTNMLPITSARYDITTAPQTSPPVESSVFIPVPEGYTLFLGAFYSYTGTGGVFAAPVNSNGTVGARVQLAGLANGADQILNESFGGGIRGVKLWVGRTSSAASTVTFTAMVGRLIKTSEVPVYGPWTEQARNLFTNPRLVGSGTWAVAKRNRALNPRATFSSATGGWSNARWFGTGGAGTYAFNVAATPPPVPGLTTMARKTWTTAPTGVDADSGFQCAQVTTSPGASETMGAWLRSSIRREAVFFLMPRDAANTNLGTRLVGPTVILEPGVWTWVAHTATMPAGAVTVIGYPDILGSRAGFPAWSVGDTLDGTGLMIGPGDYFDGSIKPADLVQPEDFRTRWLDAVNASESVLEIETVRGLTGVRCVPGVSTKDGKPALRIEPTGGGATETCFVAIANPGGFMPLSGTLLGTSHRYSDSTSGAALRNLLRVSTPPSTSSGANGAGASAQRLAYSVTARDQAALYGDGASSNTSTWWTDIGLFEGNYDGPAFSGSSPSSDLARYRWSGAVDNSESIYETRTVTGSPSKLNELQRGPWVGGQGHSGCRFAGAPTYVSNSLINGGRVGFAATFTEVGSWVYG